MNTPEWAEIAEKLSPGQRSLFLALEEPVRIAGALVESLRRAKTDKVFGDLTARQAGFAMLFGGIRILTLLGETPDEIAHVARLLALLNVPKPGARSVQTPEHESPDDERAPR